MKTFIRIISLIFVSLNVSFSQQITWQKILNNNNGLFYRALQIENAYLAVGTERINSVDKIYLVKFNSFGDTIWSRIIGPNQSAIYDGFWVDHTEDNGFIIAGDGPGPGQNAFLAKTDSNGNIQWQNVFGGGQLDQAYRVFQTTDKGYIAGGRTFSFGNGKQKLYLFEVDPFGNLGWQKAYGNESTYFADLIKVDETGYILMGLSIKGTLLFRLNLEGDTIWTKNLGNITGKSIKRLDDSRYVIGGNVLSHFSSSAIVIVDSMGIIQWERSYSGIGNEDCKSLEIVPDRGYMMAGSSDSLNILFSVRGFIRLVNFSGDVIHERYYNPGEDDDYFNSVQSTSDKGFILSGVSVSKSERSKMYIVKTDSFGNAPVNVKSNVNIIPEKFKLFQNYPNPFNSSCIIKFEIPYKSNITIAIYDPVGKLISKVIQSTLETGTYQIIFNPEDYDLSSGIYFMNLSNTDYMNISMTKSLLYIK